MPDCVCVCGMGVLLEEASLLSQIVILAVGAGSIGCIRSGESSHTHKNTELTKRRQTAVAGR